MRAERPWRGTRTNGNGEPLPGTVRGSSWSCIRTWRRRKAGCTSRATTLHRGSVGCRVRWNLGVARPAKSIARSLLGLRLRRRFRLGLAAVAGVAGNVQFAIGEFGIHLLGDLDHVAGDFFLGV